MSNRRKSRSPRAALKAGTPAKQPPVAKIQSPADALAMIPYLLGFEPHESVVVVSLTGPRRRFGPIVRGDLVEPAQVDAFVDYLANVAGSHDFGAVLVVAYSTRPEVADALVWALVDKLDASGVAVHEALRADGSRWWSYTCDRGCCPAEGTPYDPATTSVAALAVSMGMAKAASRDALAEQFARRGAAARATVTEAARAEIARIADEGLTSVDVDRLVRSALADDQLDDDRLCSLLAAVQDLRARDVAWLVMSRHSADRHYELWRQVMTAADDDLMAPAATLCAFAAWLSGRGALAATAADQVEAVDAGYPFLALIREILDGGMNPDVWEEYRESIASISGDWRRAGAAAGDAAG